MYIYIGAQVTTKTTSLGFLVILAGAADIITHRPPSSSFLWLIFRILLGHPKRNY